MSIPKEAMPGLMAIAKETSRRPVDSTYMLDQLGPDSLTDIADEIKFLIGPDRSVDAEPIYINRERLLRWEAFIRSMLGRYY